VAITFQQSASNGAANAGPVTVTFTSTPAANDLILAYYADGATTDKAMPAISTYTMQNELYANGTNDVNSALYWKYAAGSETTIVGPDMSGTIDGVSMAVMIFRGVASAAQGGPFTTAATTASGTSNGNADNASIATAAGDVVVLCAAAAAATIGTFTAPANYTTNAQLGTAGTDTSSAKAAMAYRTSGYSNPEDPAAWAMSGTSHSYTAVTLALKEAPAGGAAAAFGMLLD
jgi:hypothetical protein